MAEFEQGSNPERGKAATKHRVVRWGKPLVPYNPQRVTSAKSLLQEGPLTKSAIAR